MSEPHYFILEFETGLIDGWYSVKYTPEELADIAFSWNEKRPGYKHMVCMTESIAYLPNDKCLNRSEYEH